MHTVGKGVGEIRIGEAGGQYRVIYWAKMKDTVYVLHAFTKKSQQIRKQGIDLARKRFQLTGRPDGQTI